MDATKHALVTGGSRGIGRATSLALAEAGYYVVVNYRTQEDAAAATLDAIRKRGGDGELLPFDVTDADDVKAKLTALYKRLPRIDALVNNAGITADNIFAMMTPEQWQRVLATTLDGFYNVTKPTIKRMLRQRGGAIVSVASVVAVYPNGGQSNYAAAKAGLIAATRSLAAEVGKAGVRVNAVAPGLIATEMTAKLDTTEVLERIPMQRMGEPEEVARVIRFLVSDEASYITGQAIGVNGGII